MTLMENIVFIDIETVSQVQNFSELPPHMQNLWAKKQSYTIERDNITPEQLYNEKAWIYAEFGKIVCIVIGFYKETNWHTELVTKTFSNDDEKLLLTDFSQTIRDWSQQYIFCGHNILEFDLPYLGRRMLVNQLPLPSILQLQNKKPREIMHRDTMEMRKFGDRKSYTSLELLAAIFNIPTPKDDISGKDVNRVYHEEKNLERICTYCEKDVRVTAQVYFAITQQYSKIDTI